MPGKYTMPTQHKTEISIFTLKNADKLSLIFPMAMFIFYDDAKKQGQK
jgi:hypothetical protein